MLFILLKVNLSRKSLIRKSKVNTQLETKTKGHFLRNAGIVLGGAVAGHFLGQRAGIHHGTAAGAAAATGYVLLSPGGEVVLKRGTDFKLKLDSPLNTSSQSIQ